MNSTVRTINPTRKQYNPTTRTTNPTGKQYNPTNPTILRCRKCPKNYYSATTKEQHPPHTFCISMLCLTMLPCQSKKVIDHVVNKMCHENKF